MKTFLNGIEVNNEIIVVNDGLNYGRFFDNEIHEYELHLSKIEFKHLIEKEYNKVRDEIKEDDILNNDSSDFRNSNYCSLSALFHFEEDFHAIMECYLDIALFKKVYRDTDKSKYVINSTDAVRIENNTIIFKGRVFKKLS